MNDYFFYFFFSFLLGHQSSSNGWKTYRNEPASVDVGLTDENQMARINTITDEGRGQNEEMSWIR